METLPQNQNEQQRAFSFPLSFICFSSGPMEVIDIKSNDGFHLDFFCCSFWFFVPKKNQNEQCNVQMETSTKKPKTSNQRYLPVLVFEIELILSQKQERTTKSSKKQRMPNGNMPQNQNEQQRAFVIPILIDLLQLWTYRGSWLQKQWKTRKQ